MFEKEAEEIMMQKVIKKNDCIMTPCKTLEDCQLCDFCFDDMVDAFKDGAEFGYNEGFKACAKSRLNITTISDYPIKDEEESKCKAAYIKGIKTMANALKDYDRTDGAWTDYFEHIVDEVLKRLLKENE